jgi:hypothetical protein
MEKAFRVRIALLVIGIFLLGLYFGIKLPRLLAPKGAARAYDTPLLLQQIQTLSDLVTVKYTLEKVEVWTDPPPAVLSLFAGESRILLLAQGTVKAGIDFSKIKSDDISIHERTITIKLPPAQITDCYLNDNETKVIERTTGFLRSFDKDLEQRIRTTVLDDMRRDALRGNIRKEAEERARQQLAAFFKAVGFEKVEFPLNPGWLPTLGVEQKPGDISPSNTIRDRTVPQIQSPR